jgi:hypothetical protein
MQSDSGTPPSSENSQRSPHTVFAGIRKVFQELGLLGSNLSLQHEGAWYRVSCDDKAFMVYRVNSNSGARHHVPGWPVCLVNADTIFEECGSPGLSCDHYACGVDLERWLEIIRLHCRGDLAPAR